MIPLNSIKRYRIIYFIILFVSVAGCSTPPSQCHGCADTSFTPDVTLKLIDPVTKQDLLFGPQAKYNVNQLTIKHVAHGLLDSLPVTIKVDSAKNIFSVKLHYQTDMDTLSIQVGSLKPRRLYLNTDILPGCCARVIITSATYNGALIFRAPVDPKLRAKLHNEISVPF